MKHDVHLYAKVTNEIRRQIDSRKYVDGDKLPSERKLCKEFGVSRITIRQALDRLEEMKIIDRKQGKGTYILPFEYGGLPDIFQAFTCEVDKSGETPGIKLLDIKQVNVGVQLNEKMRLSEGAPVYELSRMRTVCGRPFSVEHSFIPCGVAPGLEKADFAIPLYQILAEDHSVKIDHAFETLQTAVLGKEDAACLHHPEGTAAMNIERFAYENDRLIEYTSCFVIGNEYKYRVDLI